MKTSVLLMVTENHDHYVNMYGVFITAMAIATVHPVQLMNVYSLLSTKWPITLIP